MWTLNGVFTLSDMTMLQLMTSELPARYSSGVMLLLVTLRSVEDSSRETLGDGTKKELSDIVPCWNYYNYLQLTLYPDIKLAGVGDREVDYTHIGSCSTGVLSSIRSV